MGLDSPFTENPSVFQRSLNYEASNDKTALGGDVRDRLNRHAIFHVPVRILSVFIWLAYLEGPLQKSLPA